MLCLLKKVAATARFIKESRVTTNTIISYMVTKYRELPSFPDVSLFFILQLIYRKNINNPGVFSETDI